MSMGSVYSEQHMSDRAMPFLFAEHVTHIIHTLDGSECEVRLGPGVYFEYSLVCCTRINCETELNLVARVETLYHDQLRSKSEQLPMDENEWVQQENDLLEDVVACRMFEPDSCDSGSESINAEEYRTTS